MRLWINVWFQPLTCRRNRRSREEFGCRIGSTSLTILLVIWDARHGEHRREGAHSDCRRNNSRETLARLGIQSWRLSSCPQERCVPSESVTEVKRDSTMKGRTVGYLVSQS